MSDLLQADINRAILRLARDKGQGSGYAASLDPPAPPEEEEEEEEVYTIHGYEGDYSFKVIGFVGRSKNAGRDPTEGETWATLLAGAGNVASESEINSSIVQVNSAWPDDGLWYENYRGIWILNKDDISGTVLPDSKVSLKIRSSYKGLEGIGIADQSVNIYNVSTSADDSLTEADYNVGNWGSTPFCDTPVALADIVIGTWYDFTLNSTGLNYINTEVVAGRHPKLGLRFISDANGTPEPTWVIGSYAAIGVYAQVTLKV